MARLPLSPRTTSPSSNNKQTYYYHRSPSLPSRGHVNSIRSSWENNNSSRLSNIRNEDDDDDEEYYGGDTTMFRAKAYLNKWSPKGYNKPPSSPKFATRSSFGTSSDSTSTIGGSNKLGLQLDSIGRGSATTGHHRRPPSSSPRRSSSSSSSRFVPNVNSPTWKSIQSSVSKSKVAQIMMCMSPKNNDVGTTSKGDDGVGRGGFFGSNASSTDEHASLTVTTSSESSTYWTLHTDDKDNNSSDEGLGNNEKKKKKKGAVVEGGSAKKEEEKTEAIIAGEPGEGKDKDTSSLLGSYVAQQNEKAQQSSHKSTHGGASSVTSSMSSKSSSMNKKQHKSTIDNITSCPSSDTSTSSLIYSLGDTVKLLPSMSIDEENDVNEDEVLGEEDDDDVIGKAVLNGDRLVLGNGNNKESMLINETNSEQDDNNEEDNTNNDEAAADLVAKTLAECRLLLEMSPPPTPISNRYRAEVQKRKVETKTVVLQQKKEGEKQFEEKMEVENTVFTRPKQPLVKMALSKSTSTNGTSDNSNAADNNSISLTKFLNCPSCAQEFSEEFENGAPLQSFACDHIICHGCVFANTNVTKNTPVESDDGSNWIACPECNASNAFDTHRPIVSRAYLCLVTKMKMEVLSHSVQSSSNNKREVNQDVIHSNISVQDHQKATVPSQICVPSPKHTAPVTNNAVEHNHNEEQQMPTVESGEELHGENVSLGTSSASVVSKRSTSSRVSLSSSHRHQALPTLAVDTSTTPAALNVIVRTASTENDNVEEEEVEKTTTIIEEPTTPVSRAEYRFLQRKAKLAQSLEKVNRILERSKAASMNNQQQGGEEVVQHPRHEKFSLHHNMVLEEVENEDDEDADEREAVRPSKAVEESNDARQQKPSFMSRRKIDLRVDTADGSSPSLQAARANKDTTYDLGRDGKKVRTTDEMNKTSTVQLNAEEVFQCNDIFRNITGGNDDSAPELVEFGIHFINQSSSNDSSLTDMNDTLFLLGGNSRTPAAASVQSSNSWIRNSPFKKNVVKGSGGAGSLLQTSSSMDYHHQQQPPSRCPQFLPSLNYSTMHESDEFVGLVAGNGAKNESPSPIWGTGSRSVSSINNRGGLATISKKAKKSQKAGKFFKQLMSQSFDDTTFPRAVMDDVVVEEENQKNIGAGNAGNQELDGPTYDFSMHSCSISPSSCEGGNGLGLVTHKPRGLHKKLMKSLRRGGLKKKR